MRYLGVAVVCILLAGCGGDPGVTRSAATAGPGHPARSVTGRLLAVQRLGERMRVITRALGRVQGHPPREPAEDRTKVTYTLWASGHGYRA